MKSLLIAKNMGRAGEPMLKDKFIALKKRLIREMSERNTQKNDYTTYISQCLEEKRIQDAINISSVMMKHFYEGSEVMQLGKKIDMLIGLCGNLQHYFKIDQLASNQYNRVENAENETPNYNAHINAEFECPILLENDVPCIMIEDCDKSVLVGVEKATVDFIVDCPLRLLLFPELVEKTKTLISHAIGIKTFVNLNKNNSDCINFKNPYTRNNVSGLIALGQHESHFKATNFALYQMFTSGKQIGNADMWLAAIYLVVKEISYLSETLELFYQYLEFRWNYNTSYASLSGNGMLINTSLSIKTALWFVISCSVLDHSLYLVNLIQFVFIYQK